MQQTLDFTQVLQVSAVAYTEDAVYVHTTAADVHVQQFCDTQQIATVEAVTFYNNNIIKVVFHFATLSTDFAQMQAFAQAILDL